MSHCRGVIVRFIVFLLACAFAYGQDISLHDLLLSANCASKGPRTTCYFSGVLSLELTDVQPLQPLLRLANSTVLELHGAGPGAKVRFASSDASAIVVESGSTLSLFNLDVLGATVAFDHGSYGFGLLQVQPLKDTATAALVPSLTMANCSVEISCPDYQQLQHALCVRGDIAVNARVSTMI